MILRGGIRVLDKCVVVIYIRTNRRGEERTPRSNAYLSEVRPGGGPRRRRRRPVRVAVLMERIFRLRVVELVRQVEAAVALLGDLDAI